MDLTAADERQLEDVWTRPRTFWGWVTDVQHRSIGARYLVTGSVFFLLAGLAALLMRIQLAYPESNLINAEVYNQLFTTHGVTMMFLFAVPIGLGLGIYLVPLMIGARDAAFPRMNAFGYWVYLIGGSVVWISLFFGSAPNSGWFNYPPLGTARFQPGLNIDIYATALAMIEVAALVAAVELIVTILKLRAPGMTLNRIPLFVWSILVTAAMVVVAMPPLIVASLLLELDSKFGTHFYSPGGGGDPLLWQHLFWFFGHPEVYIILLPGLGIVAAITATASRRGVVGYPFVVAAFIAIGIVSFGVWVHHMFATGRAEAGMSLFSVATFAIVIPSGVQIFATLATLAYGRLRMSTPLLYVFGFIFIFVAGGLTGVNVASVPVDWQVHDTYFVVAHFHYVLIGGMVFPVFGALYYWFPKLTGRMPDRRLGLWAFWTKFVGMNLTFFPMHLIGLWGMPRRVYTYPSGLGWDGLNLFTTVGAMVMALGVLLYVVNALRSLRRGTPAPGNPWDAGTLEWSVASPPPVYGFRTIPFVRDRHPLWEQPIEATADVEEDSSEERFPLSVDRRETLGTSVALAVPEQRVVQPTSTVTPLFAAVAVAVAFVGLAFHPMLPVIGLVLTATAFVVWIRPTPEERDRDWLSSGRGGPLPSNYLASLEGVRSPVYWGGVMVVVILGVVFATLFASYLYLRAGHAEWPLGGVEPRLLTGPLLLSIPLLLALPPLVFARRAVTQDDYGPAGLALLLAAVLAAVFGVLKVVEFAQLDYDQTENVSASIEWAITGFHLLHVLALVVACVAVGLFTFRGHINAARSDMVTVTSMFGYLVVGAWVPAFLLLYLGNRLL